MSNSLEKIVTQTTKVKQNLTRASEIAEKMPDKLKQLYQANINLKKEKEELKAKNEELNQQVIKLEADFSALKTEFGQKLNTSENKIVSVLRDLELTKDDLKSKTNQITAREERIKILETQNKELMENLRRRSE